MARRTTNSTSFKYLTEYYSTGSLPFKIRNHGPGVARVKVVEIINDEYVLAPGDCVTHTVAGFARVDFKSADGSEVTVESVPGECLRPPFPEAVVPSALSSQSADGESLSEEMKDVIRKVTQSQRAKIQKLLED